MNTATLRTRIDAAITMFLIAASVFAICFLMPKSITPNWMLDESLAFEKIIYSAKHISKGNRSIQSLSHKRSLRKVIDARGNLHLSDRPNLTAKVLSFNGDVLVLEVSGLSHETCVAYAYNALGQGGFFDAWGDSFIRIDGDHNASEAMRRLPPNDWADNKKSLDAWNKLTRGCGVYSRATITLGVPESAGLFPL